MVTLDLNMLFMWPLLTGRKIFIILVGLPGSGKSTIAMALKKQLGYIALGGDQVLQDRIDALTNLGTNLDIERLLGAIVQDLDLDLGSIDSAVASAIAEALQGSKNIVIDDLHLGRNEREALAEKAQEHGFKVVRVLVRTDWTLCHARTKRRAELFQMFPMQAFSRFLDKPENVPSPKEGPWLLLEPKLDEDFVYRATLMGV